MKEVLMAINPIPYFLVFKYPITDRKDDVKNTSQT